MQEKPKDAVVIQIKIEASALVEALESFAGTILDVFEYKLLEKCGAIGNKPDVKNDAKAEEKPDEDTTLEEVRAKLATLAQSGKQEQVKALIQKFGAKKLTDIPTEKYPELLKEAEAL